MTRLISLPEAAFVLAAGVAGAVLTTVACVITLALAEDIDVELDDLGDLPSHLGRWSQ